MSEKRRRESSGTERLIVAITGASGIAYGARLLKVLENEVETHLVLTRAAEKVMGIETDLEPDDLADLADQTHSPDDIAAPIASGSFPGDAMVVAPCSMKTLSAIAHGYADNLVTRAADVNLKENRPLVLVPREAPLNDVHLENMLTVSRGGATVLPASPGFYHGPETVEDLVDFVVGRVLDTLEMQHDLYERWKG
ncbi:MAG: Flavin prenyltransferase UbiX [Methanonatronarchaeales archaeon]|nr:Flavin prenyltransferase UbiX [Methanonatronarchaeales archaeon]